MGWVCVPCPYYTTWLPPEPSSVLGIVLPADVTGWPSRDSDSATNSATNRSNFSVSDTELDGEFIAPNVSASAERTSSRFIAVRVGSPAIEGRLVIHLRQPPFIEPASASVKRTIAMAKNLTLSHTVPPGISIHPNKSRKTSRIGWLLFSQSREHKFRASETVESISVAGDGFLNNPLCKRPYYPIS